MKNEKNLTCLTGALLAAAVSLGLMGSLLTGLRLEAVGMAKLLLLSASFSAVSALCLRFPRGGWVLLSLYAGAGILLWRFGGLWEQGKNFLGYIVELYDSAYGWGLPGNLTGNPNTPLIVAALGALAALGVNLTVCRRWGLTWAFLLGGLPMVLCVIVTDTVPDGGYLYLWLLGSLTLLLTAGVRREDPTQGATLTAMAMIPTALALGLLFWLVPREGYDKQPEALQERILQWVEELPTLWEAPGDGGENSPGNAVQSSQIDLSAIGSRTRQVYPVMDVTAPQSGTLYLRGQDFDLYDGKGWTANRRRTDVLHEGNLVNVGDVTVSTRRVRNVLYLPYYPGEDVILTGGRLENSRDQKIYSFPQWQLPADWRQQVQKLAGQTDTEIYLTASAAAPAEDRRYLLLPNDTRRWALDTVNQILTEPDSATAAADTIGDYVRNSARYDLETPRMDSSAGDFARWFLEESDTGYCVHFATAATVLLRAAGVEARYVEGYMVLVEAGASTTVTQDKAHAWVEYYEPLLKTWIVLDPTPPDLGGVEPESAPGEIPQATTDRETEPEAPTGAGETSPLPTEKEEAPTEPSKPSSKSGGVHGWLLLLCPAAAAIPIQRQLRLQCRRRKQTRGSTNARMLALWQETETLCRLLKQQPPELAEHLAQRAKYSPHTITEQELSAMEGELAKLRQTVEAKPLYKKCVYKYVYAAI